MQYEIYIDTLFLMNLIMNLYLLEMTNCILKYAATKKRIILGAVCGSVCMVFPLLLSIPIAMADVLGFTSSILMMSLATFRIKGFLNWLHVAEILSLITLVLGSLLHYVLIRLSDQIQTTLLWVLLPGAVCFMVLRRMFFADSNTCECKVTLKNLRSKIVVEGLIDTGNGLIEPISGAPVAVLDKKVFESLFYQQKAEGFRVIPYRGIDQKQGIMPGYLIPEMMIEWNGCCRVYQNAYVGIAPKELQKDKKYKMILNPDMLKERKIG